MTENVGPKTLITGARGYIGSALCEVFDRLGKNYGVLSREEITAFCQRGSQSSSAMDSALRGVETIVHLAGIAHRKEMTSPAEKSLYFQVNRDLVGRLFDAAKKNGVKKFIFVSTSKTLLVEKSLEVTGNYLPKESLDAYTQSKWEAENLLREGCINQNQMTCLVLQPGLVYGPRCKSNFLSLLKLIWLGLPLPLGGASDKRSYVFLGNLIALISHLVDSSQKSGYLEVVVADLTVSTSDLMAKLAKKLGRPNRIFYVPRGLMIFILRGLGAAGIFGRVFGRFELETRDVQKKLVWSFPYSADLGLQETADWYRKELASRKRRIGVRFLPRKRSSR